MRNKRTELNIDNKSQIVRFEHTLDCFSTELNQVLYSKDFSLDEEAVIMYSVFAIFGVNLFRYSHFPKRSRLEFSLSWCTFRC